MSFYPIFYFIKCAPQEIADNRLDSNGRAVDVVNWREKKRGFIPSIDEFRDLYDEYEGTFKIFFFDANHSIKVFRTEGCQQVRRNFDDLLEDANLKEVVSVERRNYHNFIDSCYYNPQEFTLSRPTVLSTKTLHPISTHKVSSGDDQYIDLDIHHIFIVSDDSLKNEYEIANFCRMPIHKNTHFFNEFNLPIVNLALDIERLNYDEVYNIYNPEKPLTYFNDAMKTILLDGIELLNALLSYKFNKVSTEYPIERTRQTFPLNMECPFYRGVILEYSIIPMNPLDSEGTLLKYLDIQTAFNQSGEYRSKLTNYVMNTVFGILLRLGLINYIDLSRNVNENLNIALKYYKENK